MKRVTHNNNNVAFEQILTGRLGVCESRCENENEKKVPADTAQTDTHLISGRTRRTSSISPPREPQPPTPAPVTPRRLDSGLPGNRNATISLNHRQIITDESL